jgi:hypothetical protein
MGQIVETLRQIQDERVKADFLYISFTPGKKTDWPFELDEHGWHCKVTIGGHGLTLRIISHQLVASSSLHSTLAGHWRHGLFLYKQGSDRPWYNEALGFTNTNLYEDEEQKHSFCDLLEISIFVEVLGVFMQAYHSGKDLKSELAAFWDKQYFNRKK